MVGARREKNNKYIISFLKNGNNHVKNDKPSGGRATGRTLDHSAISMPVFI